ncbi:prolipoprotein diacylglyceryl transferase [Syntrophomonas palmitatica]|uniref:prolipoprotein diacylglyceryl transferase n=1 Tax=Syntrophomonas palmitatica TaxID=402877 RepID=UPI0006D0815E|nr:prolipoprotein diacylglyceryl transferase family protein [Syntrophomonas palmitatica]
MHPYININLAGHELALRSYTVFMLAAAAAAVSLGCLFAARRGLPRGKTLVWAVVTAAAMLPGARIMYALTHMNIIRSQPELLWAVSPAGFSLYGGLILAAIVGWAGCCILKLPLWRMADTFVIGLAFGLALLRVGCYLNGCCFGQVTELPWGVVFPPGSFAHNYQLAAGQKGALLFGLPLVGPLPVHPTQLYELAAALFGALLAAYILRQRKKDGCAFLTFVIWFTGFRFLNRFLRAAPLPSHKTGLFEPVLYLLIMVMGVFLLISIQSGRRADESSSVCDRHITPID